MKRILVVSTTGMGDSLWGTPALRSLKKSFPGVRIDLLALPAWKSLFFENPHIDRLLEYRPQWYRQLALAARLAGHRYDHTLIFHANKDFRRMLGWLRCGTLWAHQNFDWIPPDQKTSFPDKVHGIERRLVLIEKIGARRDGPDMEIYFSPEEEKQTAAFLQENGFAPREFVYVNLGASLPHKRWHADRFEVLCRKFLEETPFGVALGGGPEERDRMHSLCARLNSPRVASVHGRSVRLNACLIGKARMMVTTDTGPMHIAFALKVPTVALFGPTDPRDSGPFEVDDRLCTIIHAQRNGVPLSMDISGQIDYFEPIEADEVWVRARALLDSSTGLQR